MFRTLDAPTGQRDTAIVAVCVANQAKHLYIADAGIRLISNIPFQFQITCKITVHTYLFVNLNCSGLHCPVEFVGKLARHKKGCCSLRLWSPQHTSFRYPTRMDIFEDNMQAASCFIIIYSYFSRSRNIAYSQTHLLANERSLLKRILENIRQISFLNKFYINFQSYRELGVAIISENFISQLTHRWHHFPQNSSKSL